MLTIPDGADTLRVLGHTWKNAVTTHIVGQPKLHRSGDNDPPFSTDLGTVITWSADAFKTVFEVPTNARKVALNMLVESPAEIDANSPLVVELRDASAKLLMPYAGLAQHPQYGPFMTLTAPVGGQARNTFELDIPADTKTLSLGGLKWGKKTALIAERPTAVFSYNDSLSLLIEQLESVPTDRPLIIIDTTAPPLGHETLSLRPNNLAIEYARQGATVLFVPFGSTQERPTILNEHLLQIDRTYAPAVIDAIVDGRDGGPNIYICSSFPSLECVARAEELRARGWRTVYEVRDDMEEFNRAGYSKWYDPLLERRMLSSSDIVLTVSDALSKKMGTLGAGSREIHTVPNGVAKSTLDGSVSLRDPARLQARNASRRIGYVGHLTSSWFDWALVTEAALRLPSVTFEIVGHGIPENINLPGNVKYLGPRSHEQLLPIVETWRVGIIPFVPTPLTRGVDPNKIYEYFAWGLRVISAPMGSVYQYPSTAVFRSVDEFTAQVELALSTDMTLSELQTISRFAEESSWANRAAEMLSLLTEAPN